MQRHRKFQGYSALIVSQKYAKSNVSADDFTLIFADDEIKIYEIKGTNLNCSEKIRAMLLEGKVSLEALQVAARAARTRGEG